jgi:hypothetical protein
MKIYAQKQNRIQVFFSKKIVILKLDPTRHFIPLDLSIKNLIHVPRKIRVSIYIDLCIAASKCIYNKCLHNRDCKEI